MPSNVARFEQLMYLSLGIGVIVSVLQFSYLESQAGIGFILFVQAFVLALFLLFIWLIARRRANWARWTFLVIFLLGLIPYMLNVVALLQRSPLSAGLNLIQLVLQALALYLIFTGNAVDWFKKSPTSIAA
jgi:hypothetical protein